ncbi:fungal fucose-specific lectin protein [Rutstroemia sp. NJR-2017a WRK4]|nr:fungal fucose-specific lectin protein [Rutstroemia sp. NJR-2017a WRK4]
MSGHSDLEVTGHPYDFYALENKSRIDPNNRNGFSKEDELFHDNSKFIGKPVFPSELPYDHYAKPPLPAELPYNHYTSSPISQSTLSPISHRSSHSNLSSQYLNGQYQGPSSPASRAPLTELNGDSNQRKRSWKWWIIGGAIILLVIIVVSVVPAVIASRKHSSVAEVSGGSASSNETTSSKPSSIKPSSTIPAVSTATNAASSAISTVAPFQRNVAALSYAVDSVNITKVYYQDNQGKILESANLATSSTWTTSEVVTAQNGSSFAAAVSMPDNDFEITVIYLDNDNLMHDIRYNPDSNSWNEGSLGDKKYAAAPNSSLSVMYWQCRLCSNGTVIVFQDENYALQFGNLTSSGWVLTQIDVDVVENTGLSLQPFPRNSQADQINIYHQNTNSNLTLSAWMGTDYKWHLNAVTYYAMAMRSPIATSASYDIVEYTNKVLTGYELWGETLVMSDSGIKVNTYSGPHNDWEGMGRHPSPMSNSTYNERVFKSMAVTAIGAAFAVVGRDEQPDVIEGYQVASDTLNWVSTGTVDIGDVWG